MMLGVSAVAPDMAYPTANPSYPSYCTCAECVGYGTQHVDSSMSGYSAASYATQMYTQPAPIPPHSVPSPHLAYPATPTTPTNCPCEACNALAQTYPPPTRVVAQPIPVELPLPPRRESVSSSTMSLTKPSRVAPAQFEQIIGTMYEMAKTPHGSSYIQACLRDFSPERFHAVCNEILPHANELLLDTHGCYVVRTLMEQMAKEDLAAFVELLSRYESVIVELSTGTLHTRRIIQFFLDNLDAHAASYLVDVIQRRCCDISRTQQGCIVVQRVLDVALPEQRTAIFDIVQRNIASFSMDPYANYVVQYMFEMGDKDMNSSCVREYFIGNVAQLACDKYASNVVEKALHFASPEAQHFIVSELYNVAPERLVAMIQDSYGNYIIQATIALCSFRDVWIIAERLQPVLHMTPYGYKIASKLERRLKGKTLTAGKPPAV